MLTRSWGVAFFMVRLVPSINSQNSGLCSRCIFEGLRKVSLCRAGCNIRKRSTNFHNGHPPQTMDIHHRQWTSTRVDGHPTADDGHPPESMDVAQGSMDISWGRQMSGELHSMTGERNYEIQYSSF
jgi:hypothetical protein